LSLKMDSTSSSNRAVSSFVRGDSRLDPAPDGLDLPYLLVAQRLWIMGGNDLARLILCLFCQDSQGTRGKRLDNHDSEQRRRRLGRPDLAVARCDSEKELHRLIRHVAVLMPGALRDKETVLWMQLIPVKRIGKVHVELSPRGENGLISGVRFNIRHLAPAEFDHAHGHVVRADKQRNQRRVLGSAPPT